MKKSTLYLYIILFLVVCVIPGPLYSLVGDYIDNENYENRQEAKAPSFSLSTLESYPKEYESYFNDRVPFRSQLIEINSLIDFFIFKESPVSKVIIGKNGWLFYNPAGTDGDPIADFTGTNLLSDEKMAEYAKNLMLIKNALEAEDKEFVVMIAPNKSTVYGEEFISSNYQKAEKTRTDLLVEYLRENTDLTIVYPKEELFNAKQEFPEYLLYHKTDTHWNAVGAYIGARNLLMSLNIVLPELNEVVITENKNHSGDLANMIAMSKYLKNDVNYTVKKYSQNSSVKTIFPFEGNSDIVHYSTEDQDDRTLFLVHDSFSSAMIPYFTTQFNNLYTVHSNQYSAKYLTQVDPDIVVFEVVERYLGNLLNYSV